MKAQDIRRTFLDFFVQHEHTEVSSSPLIPADDPSLLFTNAGMVPFKDVFLGKEKRSYHRATTVQKCLRAGGKHNDLDNVGYTARHHTFFEMLGNFSFGDYFKEEAIVFAWTLLTQYFSLPIDRLWITVYEQDEESYAIWSRLFKKERIIRIGDNKGASFASDNFWQMADTGPCGPCTEIFYDHGENVRGGLPGTPEEDGDRYMEVWNIVFMQYFRNASGEFEPLPRPCVDTGMGLERIAAVLQGKLSNYETDVFRELIDQAADLIGVEDRDLPSLKVIADHIRACAMMISDGIYPSNEGRGYVLRRIIRRALRHAHQLNGDVRILSRLSATVIEQMSCAYPDVRDRLLVIQQSLHVEEEKFAQTIDHGMHLLNQSLASYSGVLPGNIAFKLYDTFGFPVDLTADICRERGVHIDMNGFKSCMAEQQKRARTSQHFHHRHDLNAVLPEYRETAFLGYEEKSCISTVLLLLDHKKQEKIMLTEGESGYLVLDKTVFYAESGGQVGDTGTISHADVTMRVLDTLKTDKVFFHKVMVEKGVVRLGDTCCSSIDYERRLSISRHHSATHILHKALKVVLGNHVEQKGSHVNEHRLRFDFSHSTPLTAQEIKEIEIWANIEVLRNEPVKIQYKSYEEAIQSGACFLKTEKYEENVRILTIGSSCELCGGAHVNRTGDIGSIKIIDQSSVGSGVRRIEAVAGLLPITYCSELEHQFKVMSEQCAVPPQQLPERLVSLIAQVRDLKKEVHALRQEKMKQTVRNSLLKCVDIEKKTEQVSYLIEHVSCETIEEIDSFIDIAQSVKPALLICLFAGIEGKTFIRVVSTTTHLSSLALFRFLQTLFPSLKGGGTAQRVKGQVAVPVDLSKYLTIIADWIHNS